MFTRFGYVPKWEHWRFSTQNVETNSKLFILIQSNKSNQLIQVHDTFPSTWQRLICANACCILCTWYECFSGTPCIFCGRFGKKSHPIKIFVCIVCCCCGAYLSSCHRTASDANLLDDPHTFHYPDYFVIGGIRNCLEVFDDPLFLWISSNSCPPNLLLVRITKQR